MSASDQVVSLGADDNDVIGLQEEEELLLAEEGGAGGSSSNTPDDGGSKEMAEIENELERERRNGNQGEAKTGTTVSSARQPTQVYVGQFPKWWSESTVREKVLNKFTADVDDVVVVNKMVGHSYAFATFRDKQSATRAVNELKGMPSPIPGQGFLLVTLAKKQFQPHKTGQPTTIQKTIKPMKLFVGQLPHSLDPAELRGMFEPFGRILDLHFMQHKGSAFVTFENKADAHRAIAELDESKSFPGCRRPMSVTIAREGSGPPVPGVSQMPYPAPRGMSARPPPPPMFRGPPRQPRGLLPPRPLPPRGRGMHGPGPHGMGGALNSQRSMARGMGHGPPRGPPPPPHYDGYHGADHFYPREGPPRPPRGPHGPPRPRGPFGGMEPPHPHHEGMHHRQPPMAETPRLYVEGLPINCLDAHLSQVFSYYGTVQRTTVLKPRPGLSTTCGLITMSTMSEARTAIAALNGRYTMPGTDRPLHVEFSRKAGPEDGGHHSQHFGEACRLYVTGIPLSATKYDTERVFAPFGLIKEVVHMRDSETRPYSAGIVAMSRREEGLAAIGALNNIATMDGHQYLTVAFASKTRGSKTDSRPPPPSYQQQQPPQHYGGGVGPSHRPRNRFRPGPY